MVWDITDHDAAKIGLTRLGAETGKFRTIQLDHVRSLFMLVGEAFKDGGIIRTLIFGMAAAQPGNATQFFLGSHRSAKSSFHYDYLL